MKKYPAVTLSGSSLPARLGDLAEPPSLLHVHGELPRGAAVAIVGTRYPTVRGRGYARQLARDLASAGVCVLSGGAAGIDAAAHRGALDVGGTTVVVAPSGWECMSPPQHTKLFRAVVRRGGAYVSLVSDGVISARANYFPRNEVLAALAHVVVVVEAPFKSGARNTAKFARQLGRPLFVCAAPPWAKKGTGCLQELQLGARPLTSIRDILRELADQRVHPTSPNSARQPGLFENVTARARSREISSKSEVCSDGSPRERLLAALANGATYIEELCVQAVLTPAELHELLLTLRLDGVLVCDASGRVTLLK